MIRLVEVFFHMIFPGVLVFSHGPHKIFKVDCPCCSECWPHTGQALGCPCRGSRPTLRQGQSYCCLADLDRGGPGFYPFHPNFNVIFLESIFMKQDFKCSLHKYGSNKSTLFSAATVSRSFQRWTSFTARILFPKAVSTEGFLPFAGGRFHQVWRTMKPPETMGSNVQKNTISFGCGKSFPVSVTTRIISYEFSDLYTSEWTIRTIEVKEETLKKTSGNGNGVFFFSSGTIQIRQHRTFSPFWIGGISFRLVNKDDFFETCGVANGYFTLSQFSRLNHGHVSQLQRRARANVSNTTGAKHSSRFTLDTLSLRHSVENDISLTRVASGESVGLLVNWSRIFPKWCCD